MFVASSSCSEEDIAAAAASPSSSPVSATTCQQRPAAKKNSIPSLGNGYVGPTSTRAQDGKAKAKKPASKLGAAKRVMGKDRERAKKTTDIEEEVLDAPLDGWPLRRVISIEEDHLPHLLQGGPQPLLHQLSEEEDEDNEEEEAEVAQSESEPSTVSTTDRSIVPPSSHIPVLAKASQARKSRFTRVKKVPTFSRGQPVGKESQQV